MCLVRTTGVMATTNNGDSGHYIDHEVIFEAIEPFDYHAR